MEKKSIFDNLNATGLLARQQVKGKEQSSAGASSAMAKAICPACSPESVATVAANLKKYYPDADSTLLTSMAVNLLINKDKPLYPQQMSAIKSSIAASVNMTPLNMEQKDCILQPERFVRLLDEYNFPRFVNINPIILCFDSEGNLPGTIEEGEPVPGASSKTFHITHGEDDRGVCIGVLFIVKRADLLNGVCQFGVTSSVFTGSYELTNNNQEGRVSLLTAARGYDVSGTFVEDKSESGQMNVEYAASDNDNSYVIDVVDDDFVVTGINCNVKCYPLIMDRAKFSQVLQTAFGPDAAHMSGIFLQYA